MNAEARRAGILCMLQNSDSALSAAYLAGKYGVSRQVIVGDIALLRASGADISATPKGYLLSRDTVGLLKTVACRHTGEGTRHELEIMVDNGCTVRDVIVEHPLYGQLIGNLDLRSRYDVSQFVQRSAQSDAVPLSALTDGIHLHTLICPDEGCFERVIKELGEAGFLLNG